MSFRTRLTGFFVLIVVIPMVAIGFLVFRLISDSEQGKADARANGLATTAASAYDYASRSAQLDAQTLARDPGVAAAVSAGSRPALRARLAALSAQAGLQRVVVLRGSTTLADVGDPSAVAPGAATALAASRRPEFTIRVSALTAAAYASELASPTVAVVVRSGSRTLGSTLPTADGRQLPSRSTIKLGSADYRAVTVHLPGFFARKMDVTVLSNLAATQSSVHTSQLVAAIFIAGFLLLAFAFSVLASRALQGQVSRFLAAARRLGSGDFSASVPTEGRDEFAALGVEFNSMSSQLEHRLDELGQERGRLRESIRRIGQTFASNLDRTALLELALQTAVDAVQAGCGRLSSRTDDDAPLDETVRVGSLAGLEQAVLEAERYALERGELGEAQADETSVAAVPLLPHEPGGRVHGVISVGRHGRPFSDDDRDILRSLASQAALALENVDLHYQVQRQAVTDELTGLANHGRFQELLVAEVEQVRRYHHPLSLIMLDVDDFKAVNDNYGHQQGDVVLRQVARVVRESSREADAPARYGGEEMALILPHTDLEGAYAIAERVRTAVEELTIRRLDRQGVLRITASLGVAAATDGDKQSLITAADAALYEAKRQGKNRTVRASAQTAKVLSAE
jgi:diguanylate cyclase (GGDEF)-like protein